MATGGVTIKLDGYVEWLKADHVVVEGQRVRWSSDTQVKGAPLSAAVVGMEAKVAGFRGADGWVWARTIELKKNGLALFEKEVVAAGRAQEDGFLRAGAFFMPISGELKPIGQVVRSGPDVERCRRILVKLLPPAHQATPNVYVVESEIWNAMVMPNGSVWVFRGLLDDVRSDDELAVVLGHELGHFTHEHQRREEKQSLWILLAQAGAAAAIDQISDPARRELAGLGAIYGLNAWKNGYNRDQEAQADRVGLRYAFEAGFDVSAGPAVWRRMAERGDEDKLTTFFFRGHPRSETRMSKLQEEISNNYK